MLSETPLKGRILTGDALYTQRGLCRQILDAGGDYLFIVKRNQPQLYSSIELLFDEPLHGVHYAHACRTEKLKGRVETRELMASDALNSYLEWPGMAQVCRIRRVVSKQGEQSAQTRYAITSTSADPQRLLDLIRGHWRIENRLHRVRDVTMGEDACQVRTGAAPQVLAGLRSAIVGALRLMGNSNIAAACRAITWQQDAIRLVCGRAP